MAKLTAKQAMFVSEYLRDLNASAAAVRSGYSPKTASEQASRLLANVKVMAAVQEAMQKRAARVEITQDQVLRGIAFVTEQARQKQDRGAALRGYELLARHLGMLTDKVQHSGAVGQVHIFIPDNGRDPVVTDALAASPTGVIDGLSLKPVPREPDEIRSEDVKLAQPRKPAFVVVKSEAKPIEPEPSAAPATPPSAIPAAKPLCKAPEDASPEPLPAVESPVKPAKPLKPTPDEVLDALLSLYGS
ncbi:MAG: terminase small subunit [Gammaproteobacteria bacterium]